MSPHYIYSSLKNDLRRGGMHVENVSNISSEVTTIILHYYHRDEIITLRKTPAHLELFFHFILEAEVT
jgi:hypothetical protein